MYWETAHGFRWNEERILYPAPTYSFVPPTPHENLRLQEARYVLRRKGMGYAQGALQSLRVNERYELLRVERPDQLATIRYDHGFHGQEIHDGKSARWMAQDGRLVVISPGNQRLEFSSEIRMNPRLRTTIVSVQANGAPAGKFPVNLTGRIDLSAPLRQGENTLTLHSSTAPELPGNGDTRLMSILLYDARVRISAL
jgi:hypothetical protein